MADDNHVILKLVKTDHVGSWWGSMTLPQSDWMLHPRYPQRPGFTAAQLYFRSTELPSIFGLTSSTGSGATPMGGKNDEKAWECHHQSRKRWVSWNQHVGLAENQAHLKINIVYHVRFHWPCWGIPYFPRKKTKTCVSSGLSHVSACKSVQNLHSSLSTDLLEATSRMLWLMAFADCRGGYRFSFLCVVIQLYSAHGW